MGDGHTQGNGVVYDRGGAAAGVTNTLQGRTTNLPNADLSEPTPKR